MRQIDDETLVYDLSSHAATSLKEFAAKVWRRCDGETSVAGIAAALGEDERAVWLALHREKPAVKMQDSWGSGRPGRPSRASS